MIYILLMINQILTSLRRCIPLSRVSFLQQKWLCRFSKGKWNQQQNGKETVISLTRQEIDRMKALLNRTSGEVVQEENEGDDFFQGEEVKLSLKLLQVDSIQQLKPFIIQYAQRQPSSDSEANELTRCKFFVLLKYVNLEGKLLSTEINALFKDLVSNLKYLDEDILTVFLRLIANDNPAKIAFCKLAPNAVMTPHPSHNNSELLSLLLMIYPQAKEQIYVHYCLQPTRKIEEEEKQILYDPLNMVHILSHYYYYDDVHKLFENTMKTKSIEEIDCHLQEFIKNDEDLKRRKAEALIYAVSHEFDHIYNKYLTKQYFNFEEFDLKQSVTLLKSFAISSKTAQSDCIQAIKQCSSQLIQNILNKRESFITDDEQQLRQNEDYMVIGEVIANYMRKKQTFLAKEDMIQLIRSVFDANSAWRIKFDLYSVEELFSLIVSYKASKDFLRANHISLDQYNAVFAAMLTSFNHFAAEIDQKHLFYVCLFAHQLAALRFLKRETITGRLKEFGKKKELSAAAQIQLQQIIDKFENDYND